MTEAPWIAEQLRGRGIHDERVLAAMARVPRELFVPAQHREAAYADGPVPLPHGQTISQPFMVALTCQGLAIAPDACVLEVGTGSGYGAAVLAELAAEVDTVERIPELAEAAGAALAAAGYARVRVHVGDGSLGLPGRGPFDAIAVAAAAKAVPGALWEQLRQDGRIAIPLLTGRRDQRFCILERGSGGARLIAATRARFVPLITGD